MIDFNNPNTFPKELKNWGTEFEKMILRRVNTDNIEEWWQIEHQLQNIRIGESKLVTDFVKENMDTEVAVCHCARILDENEYWKHGLVTAGGKNNAGERRLRKLLVDIGLDEDKIEEVFSHVYYLWNCNKQSKTKSVHFFIDKSQVYKNDQLNYFAVNLGGEILRWSLKAMDRDLYKEEPYKRLWIMGTPSVITFKVKLGDIHEIYRNSLIAEIVKYNITKDLFGFDYEFDFTGMTVGDVPPQNILDIEEIRDYIHMQEKYPDYNGFYDELKSDFK